MRGPGRYTDIEAAERPDWIAIGNGVLAAGAGFGGHGAPFRSVVERASPAARYEVATRIDQAPRDRSRVVPRRVRS